MSLEARMLANVKDIGPPVVHRYVPKETESINRRFAISISSLCARKKSVPSMGTETEAITKSQPNDCPLKHTVTYRVQNVWMGVPFAGSSRGPWPPIRGSVEFASKTLRCAPESTRKRQPEFESSANNRSSMPPAPTAVNRRQAGRLISQAAHHQWHFQATLR